MSSDGVLYAREVMRDLREMVAEFGPDTVRECTYLTYEDPATEENPIAPNCGVGVVLYRHGVPLSALAACEGSTADLIGPKIGDYLTVESGAMKLLRVFQYIQDKGDSWGVALEVTQREFVEPGYLVGRL